MENSDDLGVIDVPEQGVPVTTLMALECLEIILNTKKVTTFKPRFIAFSEHIDYLIKHKDYFLFDDLIDEGRTTFYQNYPSIKINDIHNSIKFPDKLKVLLPSLYKELLFKVIARESQVISAEINLSKRKNTKIKKLTELVSYLAELLTEFNDQDSKEKLMSNQIKSNINQMEIHLKTFKESA